SVARGPVSTLATTLAAPAPPTATAATAAAAPFTVVPVWSYAAFGSAIVASGSTGIFGPDDYWYALRYRPSTQQYEQVYVSPHYAGGIRRIEVGDALGDASKEIVVALNGGRVLVHDAATKRILAQFTTGAFEVNGLRIADIDRDGRNE